MNITNEFKHFIVYLTTNEINGKMYIGRHATNNLNDGYLGSGKLLIKAIAKYGKENFSREILYEGTSLEDIFNKEEELVNATIVESESYYNLRTGGSVGGVFRDSVKQKISKAGKGRKVSPETIAKGLQSRKDNGNWFKSGKDHHMYGKTHTPRVKEKITKALLEKHEAGHKVWNDGLSFKEIYTDEERKRYGRNMTGDLNPSRGSKWLGNCELNLKCYVKANDTELEERLKRLGWVEKPKNFNSLKAVTKTIKGYI